MLEPFLFIEAQIRGHYGSLSYDPYGPASAFLAKPLMKVPYEGRTHLRERGRKKLYDPITKAYGLACKKKNFKPMCLQIGHMIKYLLTKLGRVGGEDIWLSVMAHGSRAYAMTSGQIFSHPALPLS